VKLADLSEDAWLCGTCPSSCGEMVKRVCRDAGFEPRVAFESNDYNVHQGYVAAGLGVTLLPDVALSNVRSDVVIRPIEPEAPVRRVWAATRAAGSRSAATEAMLAVLVETGEAFAKQHAELAAVA
jgi:DNA-binding transcriptional LysR family regulator